MIHLATSIATLLALTCTASAALPNSTRSWMLSVPSPGAYKIQIQHDVKDSALVNTEVKYAYQLGADKQIREMRMLANQPFIPFIFDVSHADKVRLTISGLPKQALDRTTVYIYNGDRHRPDRYFDPTSQNPREVAHIRELIQRSSEDTDLARTKLIIDQMIDPRIDVESELNKIDAVVRIIKAMPGFGITNDSKLEALKRYIYKPGPWNNNREYQYDLNDPLGGNIKNKLLSNYMLTKRGNCVTMPLFVVILGQRLGLDITVASAPRHVLVKYKHETHGWINLEATSGAEPARDVWVRQQNPPITDDAITNGIYLKPLNKQESIFLIAGVLSDYFFQIEDFDKIIALNDLILEYEPRNAIAMVTKGSAFSHLYRLFFGHLTSAANIPPSQVGYYHYVGQGTQLWFSKAEALGWKQPTKEQDEQYLRVIEQERRQKP